MCWHYGHSQGRSVKGVNLSDAPYHSGDAPIPVAFEVVKKPRQFCGIKTRKAKRAAAFSKNLPARAMIATCVANTPSSSAICPDRQMVCVKGGFRPIPKKGKHVISALKDNRLVALTETDKNEGRYVRAGQLELAD